MRVILFVLKCLVGLFASVGFLAVLLGLGLGAVVPQFDVFGWSPRKQAVPDNSVIQLDLAAGLIDTRPENLLSRASLGDAVVLHEAIEAIDAAARDPKVEGLVARLGRGPLGIADAQELRDAIRAFRDTGKFALAFSESFGEGGDGTLHYYLASAFESIWLQPSGGLDITGFALQSPYLREALNDLGVEPQFDQREAYKGAMAMFAEERLPEPQRQNLQRLADSWLRQVSTGIARERGLQPAVTRALIDRAPFLAADAQKRGLVDELGYWDQLDDEVVRRAGEDSEYLSLADYIERRDRGTEDGEERPVIARIHGLGPVMLTRSENDPPFGEVVMGSDTVAGAIADAVDDDSVAAIVFRVDSPGGSYVASDTIWREVRRARDLNKPVIVTMGNVAASGGYFVAAPAAKIVAQPGTVTGSIGVVAGKFVLNGLWNDLGVTWDGVQAGSNAGIWSANKPFSPKEWAKLQAFLDMVYGDFTAKVAEGRNLTKEQTRAAAQGQVWTGSDALERGLVDSLGGYSQALVLAREAAGLEPDAAVEIRDFPKARDPLEAFVEDTFGDAIESPSVRALARMLARIARVTAPLLETVEQVTGNPRDHSLRAPVADLR